MVMALEEPDFSGFGTSGARGNPTSMWDVFQSTRRSDKLGQSWDGGLNALTEAYDRRIDDVFRATGIRLRNPAIDQTLIARQGPDAAMGLLFSERLRRQHDEVLTDDGFDARLKRLAEQFPDKADIIRPHLSVREDAKEIARRAEKDALDIASRGGFGSTLAQLAGGFAAALEDPLQLAVGIVGDPGAGRSLLVHALRAAAINAGAETAMQPFVQAWRKEAGLPYGVGQAVEQIGFAALFGGGLDVAGRAAVRGMRVARGGEWIAPRDAPVAAGPETPIVPPERMLDEAAARLPPENPIRQAYEGNPEKLADALETADAAHLRELAREAQDGGAFSRYGIVDEWSHRENLAQAIRHAESPDLEPPPGRAHGEAPTTRTPDLTDEGKAPGRHFAVDGKPVSYVQVAARQIQVDPETFQFKGGGDVSGVTDRMSGVAKWDPLAAGKLVVFERMDGTRVIADGHQRLGLAKRLIAEGETAPRLDAYVFREADGWAPADVRALAAKKNLQEGSGSIIDAAKIMRERPDIVDKSVPLTSGMMRTARALTRLSDRAFDGVVAGVYPPAWAGLVADLVPDKARHGDVLDELVRMRPENLQQARIAIGDILAAPTRVDTQMTLLGLESTSRSLLPERMRVLDAAMKHLRDDARVFGVLEREAQRIEAAGNRLAGDVNAERAGEAAQMQELIAALALNSGRVSDLLNDAAHAVTQGKSARMAGEAFARRVGEIMEREGLSGLQASGDPAPQRAGQTGDFSDPAGEAAKAQIEDLEQGALFAIRAYHGTPHDFDRFDLSKIGSGEGAQAFGHGLYFAESRGVANYYRNTLSRGSPVRYRGKAIPKKYTDDLVHSGAARDEKVATAYILGKLGLGKNVLTIENELKESLADWIANVEDARKFTGFLKSLFNSDKAWTRSGARRFGDQIIADIRATLKRLDAMKVDLSEPGHLYNVSIDADPAQFVNWDAPVSGQSPEIRKKIEAAARDRPDIFGENWASGHPSDFAYNPEAGKILAKHDVAGVQYLDRGSRAAGVGSHNYVVFDDSLITITHKDGQPLTPAERDDVLFAMRQQRLGRTALDAAPYADNATAFTRAAVDAMPEIRAEIDKVIARLPDTVRLEVQDRIVFPLGDGRSAVLDGYFDRLDGVIRVALDSQNPARVARHEEVHALRNAGLFSGSEWDALRAYVRDNDLRKTYGVDDRYKEVYGRRVNDPDRLEEMLDEEAIAEAFARWRGGADMGSTLNRIFERIRKFLADVADVLGVHGFRRADDVFSAIERGDVGARYQRQQVTLPNGMTIEGVPLFAIKAYHGSPHDFERFDISRIGTGEGAQAFGHGLYFAENPAVAQSYKDILPVGDRVPRRTYSEGELRRMAASEPDPARARNLTNAADEIASGKTFAQVVNEWPRLPMEYTFGEDFLNAPGRLYEVKIDAEPDQFLDWDKPLRDQPASVRNALEGIGVKEIGERPTGDENGWTSVDGNIYSGDGVVANDQGVALLSRIAAGDPARTAERLREAGIPGIRYFDQGSRQFKLSFDNSVSASDRKIAEWAFGNNSDVARARVKLENAAKQDPAARSVLNMLDNGKISAAQKGTYNYVVFDDSLITITHKDGAPVEPVGRSEWQAEAAAGDKDRAASEVVGACKL